MAEEFLMALQAT